jgi:hypothetical protein
LVEALGHFANPADEEFLREAWDGPARRSASGISRQARHARLVRSRTSAVVASFALAARGEKEFSDFILSPAVARLRPLSAQHHTKFAHFTETTGTFSKDDCERLWNLGAPKLVDLGRRARTLGPDDLLVISSALCTVLLGVIFHPEVFAPGWRSLWKQAARHGLLENRWLRLQLSYMGVFAGHCQHYVDWTFDRQNHDREMADTFGFVRHDLSDELLAADVAHIRGDHRKPWDLLLSRAPLSTLNHLAQYVRACMRDVRHFHNEGHALMLLGWTEDVATRCRSLGKELQLEDDLTALFHGLQRIERVQQIEKSRFFRIWERTPATPVREQLMRLWSRSFTAKGAPPA